MTRKDNVTWTDPWFGSTLPPERLHAIVNAPLLGPYVPLTREQCIRFLMACYWMNGEQLVSQEGELVEEAFRRLQVDNRDH